MSHEHAPQNEDRHQLRIFLGDLDDDMNQVIVETLVNALQDKYDVRITTGYSDSETYEIWQNHKFDISILVLNNVHFKNRDRGNEKHKEQMLRFVSHVRAMTRKPVIAFYGWPNDSNFAGKAIDYGASFAFQLPYKILEFTGAVEKCLSEEPDDSNHVLQPPG